MTGPTPAREPEGEAGSPYVGLVPYGEEDAAFFFGREAEKRVVGGNLRAFRLTLFYGESGVGKTSLLRAGVLHDARAQLRAHGTEPRANFSICVFSSWRDDPLAALMETIRAAASEALGGRGLEAWQPAEPVVERLRSWTERVRTLLVVLDQFEDYFLYHPDESGDGTFAAAFPAIVNEPNLRVNFLLSIREDSLAKLDFFKGRIPRLFANYIRIEHLSRGAAEDAIEGPIREWNRRLPPEEAPYSVEPALVGAVIDAAATGTPALGEPALSGAGRSSNDAAPGSERIEAPFLQLVMERLWRATESVSARELTLSRLEQLGGAERIVENHLLEALGALAPGDRAVAADLFRFLVTSSNTKIAHQATDLAEWTGRPEAEVTAVLDRLCRGESGRILRRIPPPPTGAGATRYELFHDVLGEPILEWRREYEQERRRRATVRRFVRIGGLLASAAAVFLALGIWALIQRSEAQSATRSATSLALASAASAQADDHVERSLLLGLEALRASPSAEARSAMVEALQIARRSGATAILRGGATGVRTLAFSPDGTTLASADFDGALRLWDTKARRELGPLLGHTNEVWGLAFSPDGEALASSSFDGTVRLWSVDERSQLGAPIDAGVGAVRSVAFSTDGRTLALAGADDTVRLWDVGGGKPAGPPLRGHRGYVVSVAFSPDGRTLASGGADETVWLWDLRSRERRGRALAGHAGTVASVAFSPDGRTLASSDLAGAVRLWDVGSGEPRGGALRSETGQVWSVAFSPDGKTLAASGFDGTVRLWDAEQRRPASDPLRGHSRAAIGVAFAADGTLASASYDGTVRLWDLERGSGPEVPLGEHDDRVTTVSIGPDGRVLASGGFDSVVRLWNLDPRGARGEVGAGRMDSVESVAFGPDGETLAAADVGGSIWLWELPGGEPVGRLSGHEGAVQSIAFDPAGGTLASAGADGTVRLWDVENAEQIAEPLLGHEGSVWSVAFGPDGRTLASSGSDGTLRLWDAAEHGRVGELPLPEGEVVLAVAFGPDGRTLATGSVGGAVRLWDLEAREPRGERLGVHGSQNVQDLAFDPDGRTLASAGSDGAVRLWDVPGRSALGQALRGHRGAVYGVAFSPDGRTVASGGDDGRVLLWEGILWRDLDDLESQACSLVVRNLSEAEWQELVPGLSYRTTCPT